MLDLARTWAAVDVISGTSAGGINGAALALSQVNENAELGALRDLWAEQGDLDNLLRPPFRGQPNSLLRGDEYFLPALTRAMRGLTADFEPTEADVDLTITTTLLNGALTVTTDGLGQRLPQRHHGARFRFSTSGDLGRDNDFAPGRVGATASAMALAARCTAGFPFAFEPSFVPVGTDREGAPAGPDVEEPPGVVRPDMAAWASWAARGGEPESDQSRFAVDGGVLANTPTREALDAIDRRPAQRPMRRLMMLVFPHAPVIEAGARQVDPADRPDRPPTVAGSLTGVLGALTAQGSLTFVEEIEAHNREAARWRGGRMQVIENSDLDGVYSLVRSAWRHYRWARTRAAARTLADRVPRPEGWTHARVVEAAATGNQAWSQLTGEPLPYVPLRAPLDAPPTLAADGTLGTAWPWGTTVALGVADSAGEILRQAQGVARSGEELRELNGALVAVSDARDMMLEVRDGFDRCWWDIPGMLGLAPDATYWQTRLFCYRRAMLGPRTADEQTMTELVDKLRRAEGGPVDDPAALRQALLDTHPASTCGEQTAAAVWCVVTALLAAADVVVGIAQDRVRGPMTRLGPWAEILDPQGNPGEPTDERLRLLTRLLALDCATWLLADAESQGTSQEIRLAQLSLDLEHPFATASRTPDDKVAGSELHRFGGFLKRSWRLNDWIWGRLDAAQMLCRLVLDPERLLRIHALTGQDAESMVDQLVTASYAGAEPPDDRRFVRLRDEATEELRRLLADDPTAAERGFLPGLAALAAYPVQQRIVVQELPALAAAVRADQVAGASERSHGRRFLAQQQPLLAAIADAGPDAWHRHGAEALSAFDQAGIGREPLESESRSDAMIRTAVTAAASIVTVADSEQLGVKAVRPFTKILRGGALLPYWLVTGLTSGSGAARSLALLGFAVGGVVLTLSVLGVLGGLSSAGAAVGTGTVLGALAFAALRTGTVLHGVVLLGPVVPLVALGVRLRSESPDASADSSLTSVLTVLAVALGLIVLASLPNPVRSPAAAVVSGWRSRRLLVAVGVLVAVGAVVAVVSYVATRPESSSWSVDSLLAVPTVGGSLVVTALAVVAAVAGGWFRGRGMRLWREELGGGWRLEEQASHPAGVSAGWAAVYGVLYLAVAWGAWFLVAERHDDLADAPGWLGATLVWCAVLGLALCVAGPFLVTWSARRSLDQLVALQIGPVPTADDLLRALERRGRLFAYLVTAPGRGRGWLGSTAPALRLNARGQRLRARGRG